MLTLAILDVEHSEPGTQVTFVWGEEGGGSSKPTVERHVQLEIRATVAPVPPALQTLPRRLERLRHRCAFVSR